MTSIRPAAVAGSFYPAAAAELSQLLNHCFDQSPLGPRGVLTPSAELIAGVVPHAGPIYSGPCAAHFYARLDPSVCRVILVGVNHRAYGCSAALSPWSHWRTPLGNVTVDEEINTFLEGRLPFLEREPAAHRDEHSLEVQLPFLQRTLNAFTFVPISLSHISFGQCVELGQVLAQVVDANAAKELRTIILASSDLSHYLSPKETDRLDRMALAPVLALNPRELLKITEANHITMCGVIPTAVVLCAAKALDVKHAILLKHYHSGDIMPMRKVVGYASIALER
jgi:hypothetical protein